MIGFRLLFITDGWDGSTAARVDAALAALPAGAAAVQLRAKTLTGHALTDAAQVLREVTRARGALLLVNDRVDVALAVGADGVHLPSKGLPAKAARRVCGDRLLVGASTHSLDEARMAQAGGVDYVAFRPLVFCRRRRSRLTGSPPAPPTPAEAVAALALPVFALGGVDRRARMGITSRSAAVSCIGAVLGCSDLADVADRSRALAVEMGL